LYIYKIRPRKDHRGFDLISDALPFGACGTANRMQSAMQSGTPSFAAVKKMWAATQRTAHTHETAIRMLISNKSGKKKIHFGDNFFGPIT